MSYQVILAMFGQNGRCHQEHCRFHPSGDPTPSPEDVRLTAEAARAGDLLSIDVLDHVIIGEGYVSLREQGRYRPTDTGGKQQEEGGPS